MSTTRRLLIGLFLAVTLLSGLVPVDAADAARTPRGQTTEQEAVRTAVNASRATLGTNLRPLAMHAVMADRAQVWAEHLASCRCLEHRAAPYGTPTGWFAASENVGRGWSLEQVHNAFLGSSGHRANILKPRMTHIGTGVARAANGEIFIVHAFADFTR